MHRYYFTCYALPPTILKGRGLIKENRKKQLKNRSVGTVRRENKLFRFIYRVSRASRDKLVTN